MPYYERHLPHWNPQDAGLFITWRLKGSLPRELDFATDKGGKAFVAADRLLDCVATGPRWLEQARVAQCVLDALKYGADQLRLYDLQAWVIMCNHVHILIDPRVGMSQITKSIKNYSARQANAILGRTGAFWQVESYDRWVRNTEARNRIANYIANNPVTAGLVARPEEYRWSSSWAGREAYPTNTEHTYER